MTLKVGGVVSNDLPDDTASRPIRVESSATPL